MGLRCDKDNLPLFFELISVTHKQSEQHSEPVQLHEILWKYHSQCVSKQQVLANRSHRDECKWLWHAEKTAIVPFWTMRGVVGWVHMGAK